VRFAGLTIIDSGSVGGSGSFLYDSVHDEFVFVHRGNGTNVTSSHFVLGPETYDSLGNETYLTSNIIPKGTGKEHLIDSCIFDNGTTTCIKNNLVGTGTITLNNASANYATLNLNGAAGYGAELKFGEVTGGYLAAIRHNYNVGTGLEFYTGGLGAGNLRLYITPTGNVGIGTTSPDRKLDIACANASDTKLVIRTACGFAGAYSPSLDFHVGGYESTCTTGQIKMCGTNNYSGDMIFSTQLSGTINPLVERMRITCGGNVGIGTCTPTDKLDIYGNDTNGAIVVRGGSSQTGRNIYLFSGGISATGTLLGVTKCVNQFIYSNNSRLTIGTADAYSLGFSTSDTLRAIIDSSGIACFAATVCAPTFKGGTINGTIGSFSCHVEITDNGMGWIYGQDKNHSIILRGDRNACVSDWTNYYQYGGNLSTGKGHNFWTDGLLANQTIKMQIANNGICMTVPLYVCTNGSAFGTATGSGQAMTIQAGSNCRAIIFKNPAGADGSLWLYGTSNTINYSFSTYSVGDAFVLYNNGTYDFAGGDASDIRLKENITTIDYNATEKLMRLVPKSYNMIKYPDTKRSGFIAQEVKEVLPDFVIGEETEKDYLGLDYNGLLTISIKAIQEQQCKIKLLESCLGIS
jgi:hypothetical protein